MLLQTSHGPIVFRDSGGSGIPLLFVHGNSLNMDLFEPLLDDLVSRGRRVAAFDLPGHSSSPCSNNPERDYGLSAYAALVRELSAGLGLERPVLVGHSLGGHIAMQALAGGLDGRGLFIFGTPPLGVPPDFSAAFRLSACGDWMFRGELSTEEIAGIAASCMPPSVPAPPEVVRAIAATDPRARIELGLSLSRDTLFDEPLFLSHWDRPVGIGLGEADTFVNVQYVEALLIPSLWRGTLQIIPGAGHCPQLDRSELLAGMINDFLNNLMR